MSDKRLLLCATDAGGVSVLLPVAEYIEKHGELSCRFATDKRYYERVRAAVGDVVVVDPAPISHTAACMIEEWKPDAVLCGTTRYETIDRVMVREAANRGVRSMVVLDEWSNYRRRFENVQGELAYVPDCIAVMDDVARREAIADGLPGSVLAITGQPALTARFRDMQHSKPHPVPQLLAQYPHHLVLAFLSEELHANFVGPGSMGDPLGFDEISVLRDILDAAEELGRPVLVVDKLHPSSDSAESIRQHGRVVVATSKTIDLHALLRHSTMAVGMISVALIEAAMLGIPVASYQPNARIAGLSTATRLGLAPLLSDKQALGSWIRAHSETATVERPRITPDFVHSDAAEMIVSLALGNNQSLSENP